MKSKLWMFLQATPTTNLKLSTSDIVIQKKKVQLALYLADKDPAVLLWSLLGLFSLVQGEWRAGIYYRASKELKFLYTAVRSGRVVDARADGFARVESL